ncbi:16S rRNA (adenine(1518)-N(6)/adenine(1519)-N(6))-dimethyltransferase RsmA [Miniphocaeibacter halophilus]|uniref:16S rRNA (Adenine(1518)-N(6)/adenine(1519)-N(6))-dimethyltransferase RsmA n=1 Tax=Miniphocaeibacter halophilus TaxID=2931922 RepID=A0AC61MV40_9FIRM|nr:16S rRNA (adenine(1518)-N(6)/adenine(1519)-N(6))-dimethyltransferase RsmA [Miniphocaeibacter halophilus]QQK07984.1 16S rRNA (adenine(1518)-N(6)/adenine(1519)-N(6))-dimethyltransferase RsmA [Miniphocaeibacter halophilus]
MKDNRLYQPSYLKEVLKKFNFTFSKALGQNFLTDGNIIRKIVKESSISKEDTVLEVGPGFGTLTEELAINAKQVIAVEKDSRLMEVLEFTLEDFENVIIINNDILKENIKKIKEEFSPNRKLKVVANLPYYITTPIIEYLIENKEYIDSITIMVQEEVAKRIVATKDNKDYGSLSLYIAYNSDARIIGKAPKNIFMPSPKVDSAVVILELRNKEFNVDEDLLFKIIHSGFTKRRKNILNSLTTGFANIKKEELKEVLAELKINSNLRAENLSLNDFINITNKINDD